MKESSSGFYQFQKIGLKIQYDDIIRKVEITKFGNYLDDRCIFRWISIIF